MYQQYYTQIILLLNNLIATVVQNQGSLTKQIKFEKTRKAIPLGLLLIAIAFKAFRFQSLHVLSLVNASPKALTGKKNIKLINTENSNTYFQVE